MSNCNALDVAFENYTRVDLGVSSVSNAGTPKASRPKEATKALISDIAAQLDVLDRQRQKLANLLRDVSI
ncbi:MAG TPA: hypothetical protein VH107_09020 [Lacipirellulaceae bacterium]|nr:hypothetical protein [Lacipirellulaceae bacterium]